MATSQGLPPYKTPKQKDSASRAIIPDDGILYMSNDGKRVIDKVILDGAVVFLFLRTHRAVAHAVYKAWEKPPVAYRKNTNLIS
jgi:hypothetical protein